jgi:alkanesulfonate monooxygenase SsuD/methylene tetrahydromethanopterin reductase-like flavin-dependent oxidoreductase (luciferase family)
MAFEFGMFHEFQCPAGTSQEAAFAESFAQVDAAEKWGLDAMWLAEIHVAPERSVCAVPLTIAAAIAARTKNIKIGTGVQVLPLCHPLRIGEEAATVDQISRWRASRTPSSNDAISSQVISSWAKLAGARER